MIFWYYFYYCVEISVLSKQMYWATYTSEYGMIEIIFVVSKCHIFRSILCVPVSGIFVWIF